MACAQIASAIDTYDETGSASKASLAGLETAANQVSAGIYGAVKSHQNGEISRYMTDYALNLATSGIYGTVRSFQQGQIASGIVGIAAAAYGLYSIGDAMMDGSMGGSIAQAIGKGVSRIAGGVVGKIAAGAAFVIQVHLTDALALITGNTIGTAMVLWNGIKALAGEVMKMDIVGIARTLVVTAGKLLFPRYGMYGGWGWGGDQWGRNEALAMTQGDYGHLDHDSRGDEFDWIRLQFTLKGGRLPDGIFGTLYKVLGVGPFYLWGKAQQKWGWSGP